MKTHIIRMTRNSSWRAFEHACDILRIACDPALMSERITNYRYIPHALDFPVRIKAG